MGPRIISFFGMCFLAGILFSCLADASLACGQVNSIGIEPQWMKVNVYGLDENNFATCSVSPAENKFCCDTEAIPGFNWVLGSIVNGEIFNEQGYFAEPVSLQISGEGYDIFPVMHLKKAITINNLSKVLVLNTSEFLLNASFESPFTNISLEKNGILQQLFEGEEYQGYIAGDFGMNYLNLTASNNEREFYEPISLAILRSFNLSRTITCDKCKKDLIKSNQEGIITLNVSLSHAVSGLELKEYVPKDFEILETSGEVREYSDTHNVIIWRVSGSEISRIYRVKAPKVSFFPKKYIFKTELEDYLLKEDSIVVSRFFSFWSFDEEIKFKSSKRKTYSRISPQSPLVYKFKSGEMTRLAVFPNKTIKGAEFIVNEYLEGELNNESNHVTYYSFDTNIDTNSIEKIFVEFRIAKNNSENLTLYAFDNSWEKWEESKISINKEDGEYNYYQAYISPANKIALVGKEENSWNFFRIFG
jgi:hypothetical protein